MTTTTPWKIWKTIKLGTGIKSGEEFCSELEQRGFKIGSGTNSLLKNEAFTVALQETEVDLVVASAGEIGRIGGNYYENMCYSAQHLGLEICPAEVGPQLRLQYPDQPLGESLLIGMEKLHSGGYGMVFGVSHTKSGLYLYESFTFRGNPTCRLPDDVQFVFSLARQPLQPVALPAWNVWKTVRVGAGIKSGLEYCQALRREGFVVGGGAEEMLKQAMFTVASQEALIDLVQVSVADLGFRGGAYYHRICSRAKELGLELCPSEVGPQLRLRYLDQPPRMDGYLYLAMEPIRISPHYDGLKIFRLAGGSVGETAGNPYASGQGYLFDDSGDSRECFLPDQRFVFCLRKHSTSADSKKLVSGAV